MQKGGQLILNNSVKSLTTHKFKIHLFSRVAWTFTSALQSGVAYRQKAKAAMSVHRSIRSQHRSNKDSKVPSNKTVAYCCVSPFTSKPSTLFLVVHLPRQQLKAQNDSCNNQGGQKRTLQKELGQGIDVAGL